MALQDIVVDELRLKPEVSFRNQRRNSNQISGDDSNNIADIKPLKNHRCSKIIATGQILQE